MAVSRGVNCHDQRVPLGVVASIVPFNFPVMVNFSMESELMTGTILDNSNCPCNWKYNHRETF
jgi:hypothetical protein